MTIILSLVCILLFFASDAVGVSKGEALALTIGGIAAPFFAQIFKGRVSGPAAMLIAIVVSALVAIVATYLAGELHNFGELVKNVGSVFAIATVVYKLLLADGPSRPLPPSTTSLFGT